jgi:predicted enzyme related to lactoylglutathione lyase
MPYPVTWFQIQGKEASGLQRFYADAFAWKMAPSPDGTMAMVEKEKGGISGGIGPSQSGAPSVAVYVECDDIDAQLAKIGALGGKTALPKTELPAGMGWIAGFEDPAGNWIGLWAPPKKAEKKTAKPAKKAAEKAEKKPAKADKKTAKKAKKADKKKEKKAKKPSKKG